MRWESALGMAVRAAIWLAPAVLLLLALGSSPAWAAGGPLYDVKATWGASRLTPGDANPATAEAQFVVQARNVGEVAGMEEALRLTDELPDGLTATAVNWSQGHDY